MARATLSVCLIVRDEQQLLGGCLQSVRGLADEIVAGVDSRTTDTTATVARKNGARVHAFDWEDSFSAARNIGLKKATRDWVLIMDADDRLTEWGAAQITEVMRQPHKDVEAYGFQIQNRRLDDTVQQIDALPSVRLFPNHRGIHYENRVHEILRAKDGSALHLGWLKGGYGLVHYGYDPVIYELRHKDRRNTELLVKQLQERPTDRVMWFEMARQHVSAGRYGLAKEAATIALALPGPLRPELIVELDKIVALDIDARVHT